MNLCRFLIDSNPPYYGHELNHLETAGNAFLYPLTSACGTFSIKYTDSPGWTPLISRICAVAVILITLPLTLVGALLKGIGYLWPHAEVLATDETANITTPMKLQQCYDLTEILHKVFVENGLTKMVNGVVQPLFVMVSGTALGAVRHGGIIPWDDDIDLAVFREDEEKFLALREALAEEGVAIRDLRFDSTYKLHFTQEKIREKYGDVKAADNGEIDVFVWDKMSDGSYTYATAFARSRWPTEYFTSDDMERGFEMVPFGPPEKELELPLLKAPEEYLSRYYGENYMDLGVETHGHLSVDCGCGTLSIPFIKLNAHYFKIETWKNRHAAWI